MRVEYVRDGLIEEFHDGVFVRLNDIPAEPYFLRSCAKPLQASLLVDYGIYLTEEEFAFVCGSHAGEECHIEIAQKLLNKFGLDESDLKCGIHPPLSRTMQDKMLLKGEAPRAIHNNCSGKHIGFLAICKAKGWDLKTYYKPQHPLQIAVKKKIYELCEVSPHPNPPHPGRKSKMRLINAVDASPSTGEAGWNPDEGAYPSTTDGCGVPIVSMPLSNLITGFKNLNKNYPQIVNAILNHPYIFGGENRLDTEIIQNTEGLIAKVGAGGLCVVYNTKLNDGFAVKMYDASMPARRFAVLETINRLGWGKIEFDKTIKTISGKKVGEVKII